MSFATRARDRVARKKKRVAVSFPKYVGSADDLRRALVDMNRRGELAVIKR